MMITPQILSIPPYLSCSWKQISFIYTVPQGENFQLVVVLNNHTKVAIPNLDKSSVDLIFEHHTRYGIFSNQEVGTGILSRPPANMGLEFFNLAMQHNPEQAHAPDLPKEILEKVSGISKILGLEDLSTIQKPEPHCNCSFCQIARALFSETTLALEEEEPSDEDLSFRSWNIQQSGDKLYTVTNPLNEREHYSVYLGEPLGCTCGLKNCEHIRAVLNS